MITVNKNYTPEAIEKIKTGKKEKMDQKANAMKERIGDALISFAEQSNEFAQAIAEGGTFAKCMEHVAKGVGNSISDFEATEKAADFYFSGAKIKFHMTIEFDEGRMVDYPFKLLDELELAYAITIHKSQ